MYMNGFSQKGWEAGGWLGASYYFGDLNTDYRLSKPGLAGGIVGRNNFNTRVSATFSLNYGRIRASDSDSKNNFEQQRNLSFYSDVFDLGVAMEFNFFNYVHGSNDEWYTPYIFGGFSVFNYNPKTKLDNNVYSLRDYGTEGQFLGEEYGSINMALNVGIGYKWDITEDLSFNVFLGSRLTRTDYLDDVSTQYPLSAQLEGSRGPIAAALSDRSGIEGFATEGKQRGDSNTRDTYHFIGIGLMKYFGQLECPKISKF